MASERLRALRPLTGPARAAGSAPLYATLVIAALGVADLARLSLDTYRWHHVPAAELRVAAVPQGLSRGINVSRIVSGHLFGNAPATATSGDPRVAPDADSSFLLSGVIASASPNLGSAILGRTGQNAHLYQVGESLAGQSSGRLYEVYSDRVILDIGGSLRTLRLPRLARGSGATAAPAGKPQQTGAQDMPGAEPPPGGLVQVFRSMNPAPRFFAGQFGGLRLTLPVDDENRFGVRNGDVVVAVNGVKLTSAKALNGLLSGQAATASLTIVRDGTQHVIEMTGAD